MNRFLDEVLESLSATHDSFEQLVFVLPNKRAGTFLINALAKRANKTAFAPRIISIEELLENLSGRKKASQTLQLFELYNAYLDQQKDPEPFHEFLNWAGSLLHDFNEIDRYLVDHKNLFSYLSDIHEIRQWGVSADSTPMVENYLRFWKELHPLYERFQANLMAKGYAHSGGIYRLASEKAGAYIEENPGQVHIFIGFNALTKAEAMIIQNILQHTDSKIYWDMDAMFLQDPDHDASFFLREYQRQWPSLQKDGLLGISEHYGNPKNIHAIGVPKRVSQAQYVGNLVQSLKGNGSAELHDTAIVLGDESLLNPLLHAMPDSIPQMNITMGYPLDKVPMAAFFRQILMTYARQDARGWQVKDVLDVLGQPYVNRLLHDHAQEILNSIHSRIDAMRSTSVGPSKLRSDLDKENCLELLFPDAPLRADSAVTSINVIIAHLKAQFDANQKKIDLEYLHGIYRIFNQLELHIRDYPFLNDLQSLLQLYESLLQLEQIDMRGEPLQGLQIMGMLESRVLDFNTVVITSLNEGILPAGKSDSSMIPFDVRHQFGLPTYKEKDAIYTYHFYRLLQRAEHVYLVYNTEPDVLVGGEKSRLIMQLQQDPVHGNTLKEYVAVAKDKLFPRPITAIAKTPELMQALAIQFDKGLSPTLLSSYIRDPLEFYKKAILEIQDTITDPIYVDAITLGTFTHRAAEALYTPLKGKLLSRELLRRQEDRILEIVDRVFQEFFPKTSYASGRNYLAFHVVVRYLQRLLEHDIQACQQNQIEILDLEKKLELELSFPGVPDPVRLIGVVDRIDRCDGQIRLIDYKTGRLDPSELRISSWDDLIRNDKRQKAFQVLCYALLASTRYKQEAFSAGIISFKNLNRGVELVEIKSAGASNSDITSTELALFREQLMILLQEICNTALPFEERQVS